VDAEALRDMEGGAAVFPPIVTKNPLPEEAGVILTNEQLQLLENAVKTRRSSRRR
jgi:hypothetical protein